MYPHGINDNFSGWGKNFASGAMSVGFLNMILVSRLLVFVYSAIAGLFTAFAPISVFALSLYVLYGMEIYWMARRIGNFKPTLIIFYPVHALFFLIVFMFSLYRTFVKRRVSWKGRDIDI